MRPGDLFHVSADGRFHVDVKANLPALPALPLSDALDAYERRLLSAALAQSDGNVAEAARLLQTDRPNLYRRMRRLGLAAAGE